MVNAWYHLVLTVDPNGTKLYLNGQAVMSSPIVPSTYVAGKEGFIGAIPTGAGIGPYVDGNYPFFKGDDRRNCGL
jgi:hypothetical protein